MNKFALPSFAFTVLLSFTPLVAANNPPNILFVGNSFTQGNGYGSGLITDTNGSGNGGVPGIFKKMASDLGYNCNVYIEAVGGENYAYHYNNKSSIIGQAQWDIVVLQDYSTEPTTDSADSPGGFGIASFNTYLPLLKTLIRNANPNAKIILYETWARPGLCSMPGGPSGYFTGTAPLYGMVTMLSQLHTNYFTANDTYSLDGVAPVGDAFALAIADGYAEANPYMPEIGKLDLWGPDYYHAGNPGWYLSAAVFIAKITGLDPRTIPTGSGSAAAGNGLTSTNGANLNFVAYSIVPRAPTITSASSITFGTGISGSFTVTTQGLPASTFSATGLPSWASLDPNTGVLSGTPPDASGSPFTITITANNGIAPNAVQTFTLNVVTSSAPTINNGPAPSTIPINTAYNFTYSISGAPTPTLTLLSGNLPTGMTLSSGVLSGTPTVAGFYSGTVSASNGVGSAATQNFSIAVQQAPGITNGPPSTASLSTGYNFSYTTTGYPAPTFTLASGSLPTGITLSSSGTLSGSPTVAGVFSGTVRASNGVGTAATSNFSITVSGTFTQWATIYFNGAGTNISGPSAMPLNDGTTNLIKYLCDIKPNVTMTTTDRAALPTMSVIMNGTTPYLTLTYRQNPIATGLTIHVQTSSDLANWTTVVPDISIYSAGADPTTHDAIVKVEVNAQGASRKYIRLNVVTP